jgi:hypothetical protein
MRSGAEMINRDMNTKQLTIWFSTVSTILVLWGIVFAFFGLAILPVKNRDVLLPWESALYGAIMMGWGVTLLMTGRIAFRRNDPELMKALLCGIILWLIVEGLFSAYLGVWFNVGVDIAVLMLFSFPLIKALLVCRD